MSIFHDWRNQLSWGRVCAFVALVVAVIGQFTGIDTAHLALWLGVALGNYGASKITEMVCGRSNVEVAASPATGDGSSARAASDVPTPSSAQIAMPEGQRLRVALPGVVYPLPVNTAFAASPDGGQ